jgi:hypothetical protein
MTANILPGKVKARNLLRRGFIGGFSMEVDVLEIETPQDGDHGWIVLIVLLDGLFAPIIAPYNGIIAQNTCFFHPRQFTGLTRSALPSIRLWH